MKRALLLFVVVLLAGCNVPQDTSAPDQCLRREIFKECLAALPAGPVATKYNDWDEVVEECERSAYYQSRRNIEAIKPECRP